MRIENKPPVYEGDDKYIFISYSHKSEDAIYDILWKMFNKGIRFWYDDGLHKGENWEKEVEKKLLDSEACFFFFDSNFLESTSLAKEVSIVSNNGLKYIPIYYQGKNYKEIYVSNPDAKMSDDIDDLYHTCFHPKITSIFNLDELEFLNEILSTVKKLDCCGKIQSTEKKEQTKKVLFLGKNSAFTRTIVEGVREYYSELDNVILDVKYIEPKSLIPMEQQFIDLLKKCNGLYNGAIIRPLSQMNEKVFEVFQEFCQNTKVILLNENLTAVQYKNIGNKAPIFISSNFENGGLKIANMINRLSYIYGIEYTNIIICDGPNNNIPAKIRSKVISDNVKLFNNNNISFVDIPTLDAEKCSNMIIDQLKKIVSENKYYNDNCLMIYCGNDNVAIAISKKIRDIVVEKTFKLKFKKYILIGYDGLKSPSTGNYSLDDINFDYISVDVIPVEQGRYSAKCLIEYMKGELLSKEILVEPILIGKYSMRPKKISKLDAIMPLIKNSKLFIWDLDGTLADTETYHWKAYNVLMKEKYGIVLDDEHISKYIGNNEMKIYDMIENDYEIIIDKEDFLKQRLKIYLDLVVEEDLKLFEWVDYIRNNITNQKVLLLTSQVPEVVDYLLNYWNLDELIPKSNRISCHNGKITKKEVFDNPSNFIKVDEIYTDYEVAVFEDSNHVAEYAFKKGYLVIGILHKYNYNTLKACSFLLDLNFKKGLFVGLCGIDIVFDTNGYPVENMKIKTNNYDLRLGGPALNAAIKYSQLGGSATLLCEIGNHPTAKLIRKILDEYNIEIIDIANMKEVPNISCVVLNRLNSTRTIFSGQSKSNYHHVNLSFVKDFDFCLYDCNLIDFTKELVDTIKNYDIPFVLDCGSWKDNIEYAINNANVIISSESFKNSDGKDIFELTSNYQYVAKTRGEKSILYRNHEICEIPVEKVTSAFTLGAGDVFHGAFCYFYFNRKMDFKDSLNNASKETKKYIETN